MIRVLIVDDLRISREAIARALGERDEITVVGTAPDAQLALAMAEDLEPDVVLVNMRMPSSAELVGGISESCNRTVVLTLGDSPDRRPSLLHDASVDDVVAEIHGAVRCFAIMPYQVAQSRAVEVAGLTPREQEIVQLIDRGLSNKEIARQLNMAVSTVKNHVHSVLEKLNVQRRGQAAALVRAKSTWRRIRKETQTAPRGQRA